MGVAEKKEDAVATTAYRSAFRAHKGILFFSAIYALFIAGSLVYFGVPLVEALSVIKITANLLIKALLFLLFSAAAVFVYRLLQPVGPWPGVEKKIRQACRAFGHDFCEYLAGHKLPHAFCGMLVVFTIGLFALFKPLIPLFKPYTWDPLFASWDRIVHMGYYPHTFVVPAVDKIDAGGFLIACYAGWFLVMYGITGYAVFFDGNHYRRQRFLWSFLLSWVLLGSVMAVLFSSAGPLFFGYFYPKQVDVYADFLKYMNGSPAHEIPLMVRKLMISWYEDKYKMGVNAISAMPSMHVAVAWVVTLYTFSLSRLLGCVLFSFSLVIVVGSVYTGFHYAIDGYVSIACMTIIWGLTGRILKYGKAEVVCYRGLSEEDNKGKNK